MSGGIRIAWLAILVPCAIASLLFPENSVFQITLGVSVPIAMSTRGNAFFNVGFQMNYVLPWNESQFEPTVISARRKRGLDLVDVYETIVGFLNEHGWRDGRQCLLRTVCELAEMPLARSGRDVIEEAAHFIFTPSEDLPGAINSTRRSVDAMYHEAEKLGKSGADCILTYPDCVESPLLSFTGIVFS